MSIRLRRTEVGLVALCAARSVKQPGDVYFDDEVHHALAVKFALDSRRADLLRLQDLGREFCRFNRHADETIILNCMGWLYSQGVCEGTAGAYIGTPVAAAIAREESNNANRDEWDKFFAPPAAPEREPLKGEREHGEVSHKEVARFANWYKESRRPNCSKREIERIVTEFAAYLTAERAPVAPPPKEGTP